MTKFKVGDKVVGNAEASKRYSITREGWRGTVVQVYLSGINIKSDVDGSTFHDLDPDCFDLVGATEKKAVIISDGKNTTATLYENGRIVARGVAKRNDSDTDDFGVGAKLALDRALDKAKEKDTPPKGRYVVVKSGMHCFKIGEVVKKAKPDSSIFYNKNGTGQYLSKDQVIKLVED